MIGHNLGNQRQPEAGATTLGRDKGLEDMIGEIGIDTRTIVDDAHFKRQRYWAAATFAAHPQSGFIGGSNFNSAIFANGFCGVL